MRGFSAAGTGTRLAVPTSNPKRHLSSKSLGHVRRDRMPRSQANVRLRVMRSLLCQAYQRSGM